MDQSLKNVCLALNIKNDYPAFVMNKDVQKKLKFRPRLTLAIASKFLIVVSMLGPVSDEGCHSKHNGLDTHNLMVACLDGWTKKDQERANAAADKSSDSNSDSEVKACMMLTADVVSTTQKKPIAHHAAVARAWKKNREVHNCKATQDALKNGWNLTVLMAIEKTIPNVVRPNGAWLLIATEQEFYPNFSGIDVEAAHSRLGRSELKR